MEVFENMFLTKVLGAAVSTNRRQRVNIIVASNKSFETRALEIKALANSPVLKDAAAVDRWYNHCMTGFKKKKQELGYDDSSVDE